VDQTCPGGRSLYFTGNKKNSTQIQLPVLKKFAVENYTKLTQNHVQLAKAENLTTVSILTAFFSRILQIRGVGFTARAPLFVISSLLRSVTCLWNMTGAVDLRLYSSLNERVILWHCPFKKRYLSLEHGWSGGAAPILQPV
jgi:hypothetical protein